MNSVLGWVTREKKIYRQLDTLLCHGSPVTVTRLGANADCDKVGSLKGTSECCFQSQRAGGACSSAAGKKYATFIRVVLIQDSGCEWGTHRQLPGCQSELAIGNLEDSHGHGRQEVRDQIC